MSGLLVTACQPLAVSAEVIPSSMRFCVNVPGLLVPSASWKVWNCDQLIVWS